MIAKDGGDPQRTGSVDVTINVLDANDNAPVFENISHVAVILESHELDSIVHRVSAIDKDKGDNGRVTYSFSEQTLKDYGKIFRIDANKGNIFLRMGLDREKQVEYWLYVVASDSPAEGRLTTQTTVNIHLIDLNDNAPHIKLSPDKIPHELSLLSRTETFVAHFTVNDPDYKDNGQLWCWISTNYATHHDSIDTEIMLEDMMALNFSTDYNFSLLRMHPTEFKIVTSRNFSISDDVSISFVITCHDMGTPVLTSQKTFTVSFVMPEYELETRFKRTQYTLMVQENNKVGAPLMQLELVKRPKINSYDPPLIGAKRKQYISDRPITDLSAYKFSVTKKDRYKWHVASVNGSGWVLAQIIFDRENIPLYNLEIVALLKSSFTTFENSTHKRSSLHRSQYRSKADRTISKTNLRIEVEDMDDERPFFMQPDYHFYVSDRGAMTLGSIVGVVKAVDKDTAKYSSITYRLSHSSSPSSSFPSSSYYSSSSLSSSFSDKTASTQPPLDRPSLSLPFQIHSKTGLISLNRRLDYESLLRHSDSPYVFNALAESTYRKRKVHAKVKVQVEYGDNNNHNDVILIDFNSISQTASGLAKHNPTVYLRDDAKTGDEIVAWTQKVNRPECCLKYRLVQEVVEGKASLNSLTPSQRLNLFNVDPLTGSIKINFDVASLSSSIHVKLTIIMVNDTSMLDNYERNFVQRHASTQVDSGSLRVVFQKYTSHALHAKQVYKILSSEKLAVILSVTLVAIFTAILALLVIICLAKLKKMRIYNFNQTRTNAKLSVSGDNFATTTINANAIAQLNNNNLTLNKVKHSDSNYYATYNTEHNVVSNNFLKTSIVDDCLLNDLGGRLPCEGHDDVTMTCHDESMTSLNGLLVGRSVDKKEVF